MNWIEVHIDTRPDRLDDLCARLEAAGVTGLVIDDEADFKDFLEITTSIGTMWTTSFCGRKRACAA